MSAAFLACLVIAGPAANAVVDRPVPRLLVGSALAGELEATIPGAAWQGIECRRVFRRVADDRRIALVLDRRIDPNRPLTLEVSRQSVAEVLAQLAEQADAAVSVAGNTVYVGPADSAASLRTLIELRTGELRSLAANLPRDRRLALLRRETFHWNDLDEPRRILDEIAERFQLRIVGADAIPHDLWAGATLPDANVAEALSLVLIQFGLTVRWSPDATAVELVALPERVFVEKTHRPRGTSPAVAAAEWQRLFAGVEAEPRGAAVLVRGTVEQHEAIERVVSGRPERRPVAGRVPPPASLESRQFTIQQRVTAAALIETLEKSGIRIAHDADALATAGIDLHTAIDLDLTKATADEFFRAWCQPLGLDFAIDGLTVTLTPRRK